MNSPITTPSPGRRIAASEVVLPPTAKLRGARGRILNAALKLFAELGYADTSVRAILSEAGAQATTLYSHFPSKEHVLAEIIRLGYEEELRRLREALLTAQPDPRDQLKAVVRATVLTHCEYSMLAVVTSAEFHVLSDEMSAPIQSMNNQAERLALEVIERGQALGVFKIEDPVLALRAIASMGHRAAYWFASDAGRTPAHVAESFAGYALLIATGGASA